MHKRVFSYCLALILLLAPASALALEDARIVGVGVSHNSGLRVSFSVTDAFTKEIEEAVKSGIPTAFTFIVKLDRVRDLWADEGIGVWKFKHTVRYDSLKDEYEVRRDEAGPEAMRTKDLDEMKKAMTTCADIGLFPSEALAKGQTYEIRIMAELRTVKLPFMLDYVFFFVKLWDVDTGWYAHRFSP